MHFELDDETTLLQRTVRDFASAEVAPVAEELDREKRFPYELVSKMGELGWMGIPFPESVGGAGGDTLAYALAVEELTRVDSSVAITLCAHTSLGTQPIYLFGSEEQKREWLPRLCAGELLGAFGLTEPDAGSDAGHAPAVLRRLPRAAGEPARAARCRLQAVPAHPRHRAHRRRRDGRRPRPGGTRRGAEVRQAAPRLRQADLQVPGDSVQARRHVHRDRGGAAARLQGRAGEGRQAQLHADRGAGQAEDRPPGRSLRRGGRADTRRLRLHRGVPRLPLLPRREDPHNRRGHRRGAADGHRTRARRVITRFRWSGPTGWKA